ncbi:hypothetical protein [Nocardia asteroides]|uniref:hypothetical protein n=1 Tax=Nocardia asteroides TaxID=1824 RepID=UPI001E644947|nr:hypothetical protein [Nocardia asteroides]UGT62837.1 hypothetical protein LTT61_05735 [Nocardia asteroides]
MNRPHVSGSGLIDRFVESPLAGLAPWIVMSLFNGPGRFEEAVAAALGIALLVFVAARRHGTSVKLLELFDLAFFGTLAVIGILATPGAIEWLELWAGEISNIALALFALGSLLARVPFTLQYAREQTPREYWLSPLFLRVNNAITGVWAAAFGLNALLGFLADGVQHDPDNFWTGWVLQLGGTLFAIAFTEWYPEYAPNRAAQEAGEPTEPPRPVARLLDWFPPYLIGVGVAGLITDGTSAAVGIGLIVAGIAGGAVLRRVAPAARAGSPQRLS